MQGCWAPVASPTLPRLVRAAAARWAGASAIEDGAKALSFADLAEAGLQAARALLACGVKRGDRAAIWAPNLAEWIVAAIGIHSAGAVLVPLNTRFKGAEAAYVLRRSGARILFTVAEFLGTRYVDLLTGHDLPQLERIVTLRGEAAGATSWTELLSLAGGVSRADALVRADDVSPDDLSDLLFTSGTSGKPKGVMTTHAQNLRTFVSWSEIVGLREGDRYLVVNPFFHSFGYKAGWMSALLRGATVLPHAVFDAGGVLKRIANERVSFLPGPPTLYQSLLVHPDRKKYDLSSLRLAATGAAVIPVDLVRSMREELGFGTVVTAYGLTETCGVVTMCRPEDDLETIATTSGRAIPGVEVRCVDPAGKELPRGEAGEVVVRGYNVMKGYFDDDEETSKAIDAEGWLHTGDVGVMDARGNLRITDRIKDMFIVGGFNCYPAEIEGLMYGLSGVAQVAVVGIPDERLGEVGAAFVVPTPGAQLAPDAVIAWCRENMANYKVPRRVEIVDALPTNASGKIMKFRLREEAMDVQSTSS
ncbi:MAG TPA: fatty acid--CoA ligase [Deltaproteobacteria bacterium]|nr:fatty acid--CoA ligase [Deltaproteobacteria bacterium]